MLAQSLVQPHTHSIKKLIQTINNPEKTCFLTRFVPQPHTTSIHANRSKQPGAGTAYACAAKTVKRGYWNISIGVSVAKTFKKSNFRPPIYQNTMNSIPHPEVYTPLFSLCEEVPGWLLKTLAAHQQSAAVTPSGDCIFL